jgi:hypothetical protein
LSVRPEEFSRLNISWESHEAQTVVQPLAYGEYETAGKFRISSRGKLSPRADERAPDERVVPVRREAENFDGRAVAALLSDEARAKNACVVQDEQIAGPEEVREV